MPNPGNPYNTSFISDDTHGKFFPAANQALKQLILNLYDAHVADLLANNNYGLYAAEQTKHEEILITFFDQNPNIEGTDKALVTEWYNKNYVSNKNELKKDVFDLAKQKINKKSATKSTLVKLYEESRKQEELLEIEQKKATYDDLQDKFKTLQAKLITKHDAYKINRKDWITAKKTERQSFVSKLNSLNDTTDLLSVFTIFNYESRKHFKTIKEIGKDTKISTLEKHQQVEKLSNGFLASSIEYLQNQDPEKYIEKIKNRIQTANTDENPSEEQINYIKNLEKDKIEYEKFLESYNALKISSTNAPEYYQKLLKELSQENLDELSELEKAEWWAVKGRIYFMLYFALFTGTTMSGALVTMGIEWKNPILITLFSIIAIPIFIIVSIANWYIVKNVTEIVREFFTKEKSAWEWFLILFGFASTLLSVAYTYYATNIFLTSLAELNSKESNQLDDGNNSDDVDNIDNVELPEGIEELFMGLSIFAGVATAIAYFAIMHYYNKKISWSLLPQTFKRIGDLAVIANINWHTYLTRQILFKLALGLAFISLGLTYVPTLMLSGAVLTIAAVAYILTTAIHYNLHKAANKNDQRLFMHVQLALILVLSLGSIFFLMWAALPVLTTLLFGSEIAAITVLVLSWLGTACLYTLSTTGTFENILRKNINMPNLAENASSELKEIIIQETNDTSKPLEINRSLSWVENFWEVIKIGNGIGNGLPAMVGAWEFAADEGIGEDIYIKILLSGSMFLYASGISYACNFNGIEQDKTFKPQIFARQERQVLLNQVRRCYPNLDAAILSLEETISTLQNGWFNHTEIAACTSALEILRSLKSESKNTSIKTLTNSEMNTLGSNPKLSGIYTDIMPYLEVADLNNRKKTIINDLGTIIDKLQNEYIDVRDAEQEYHFPFGWNVIPGMPKPQKLDAANALKDNLVAIKNAIKTNTPSKLHKFTANQLSALSQGRLLEYFEQAKKLLMPTYIPLHNASDNQLAQNTTLCKASNN